MELCDEVGFYVLDEIPSCWVANEIGNPSRTWAYVFRSKETLARDKNRACVVIWSCGNESSYGVNNQAEFDYMKANDPTRLALISQQNLDKNPRSDFEEGVTAPPLFCKILLGNLLRFPKLENRGLPGLDIIVQLRCRYHAAAVSSPEPRRPP
jgi:hypothetical protein